MKRKSHKVQVYQRHDPDDTKRQPRNVLQFSLRMATRSTYNQPILVRLLHSAGKVPLNWLPFNRLQTSNRRRANATPKHKKDNHPSQNPTNNKLHKDEAKESQNERTKMTNKAPGGGDRQNHQRRKKTGQK